ncbi:MAG: twin-arginine translocase TatA/TatE family subunit [Candidatus Kinetoplastibacterium crithidii]|nr:MAG: twin-arginine translocase TatA/TatE family subunit [Candidatus Kinetoplastibacterium crithidii]
MEIKMAYFRIWHWLVIILLALILFGSKKMNCIKKKLGLVLKKLKMEKSDFDNSKD